MDPESGETILVNYTTPSRTQHGGTCYLFSDLGAFEILYSYLVAQRLYDPWSLEDPLEPVRQRGLRFSPINLWQCTKCIDGVDFTRDVGVADECLDPYFHPSADSGPGLHAFDTQGQFRCARGRCGHCFRHLYLDPSDPAYPYHDLCGPLQAGSSEILYHRHTGSKKVPLNHDRSEQDMIWLALAIWTKGPVGEGVWWGITEDQPVPGLGPEPTLRCNPMAQDQGHAVHLVGYDIRPGYNHFLVRNSHGDDTFYWIDYYEWAGSRDSDGDGSPDVNGHCELATVSWYYDDILPPVTADLQDPENPVAAWCDQDQDGRMGVVEQGKYCTLPLECSQEDNCPAASNPDQHDSNLDGLGDACDPVAYDPDPDGDGIPSSQDNCPSVHNPLQADLDGDGIGDKCDDDMDNDGYENRNDCHPLNPMVGPDMDDDGYCDSYNVSCGNGTNATPCEDMCLEACGNVEIWYGTGTYEICLDRCLFLDNCIDLSSSYCRPWIECAMAGSGCTPDTRMCGAAYSNPDQSDIDGDRIGDKCEAAPTVSELKLWEYESSVSKFGGGGTPQGILYVKGELYNVSLRTRGGTVRRSWQGNPVFTPEPRTGVRIGACHCDQTRPDGEWDENCGLPDVCNMGGELNTDTGYLAWNPINAQECNDYDLHPQAPFQVETVDSKLCHEREMSFTKDDSANERLFLWPWRKSVRYESFGQVVGQDFDSSAHTGRSTKIRAYWADFGQEQVAYLPPDPEVTYSRNIRIREQVYIHVAPYLTNEQIKVHIRESLRREILEEAAADYFLAANADAGTAHLYRLRAGFPEVDHVWEIDPRGLDLAAGFSGSSGLLNGQILGLGQGQHRALFLYQKPRLLVGVATEDSTMVLMSTEDLFDAPGTDLHEAQVVYSPGLQSVLLFGRSDPSQDELQVFRIDLQDGAWHGPGVFRIPSVNHGYSLSYDPVKETVYLFGGGTYSAAPSARIYEIDPVTFAIKELVPVEPPPETLARLGSGAYLDPLKRELFVYGGRSNGTILTDAWKLNLASMTWERLSESAGPEVSGIPVVYYDRFAKNLWIGDLVGRNTGQSLSLWALDSGLKWHQTETRVLQSGQEWPIDDFYVPGKSSSYSFPTSPSSVWPGEVLVARVVSEGRSLGLIVLSQWADPLSKGEPSQADAVEAGFVCPAGQPCLIRVEPTPGSSPSPWLPFHLEMLPAELQLEGEKTLAGKITDLELHKDTLFVSGAHGLVAYGAGANLPERGSIHGPSASALTGIALCGTHLCVSRVGLFGLDVIKISDPYDLKITGRAPTFGPGWDVAAQGGKVYVANGFFGVGIYDVAKPYAPSWTRQIWPLGRIVSVAVRRSILAAARENGTVYLYDISKEPRLVGEISAEGRLSRVRFVSGNLWVLGNTEQGAEIFDVHNPASPIRLGGIDQDAPLHLRARYKGTRAYTFQGKKVKAYRFQAGN